jgi:hypothetical protein
MTRSESIEHVNTLRRTLYHFPIIHTSVDMGALSETIRRSALHEMGEAAWKRKMAVIDRTWTDIEGFIDELRLPFEEVRLYQDGLPVCGKEVDIVRELADNGSRNHRLLLRMVKMGATVMGTESPELLVEEYELAKKLLDGGNSPIDGDSPKNLSERVLDKRDHFIALRINETLRPGETGLLFLGMLHTVGNLLDEDIQVIPVQPTCAKRGGGRS